MKCCGRKARTYKRKGYHWCPRCDARWDISTGALIVPPEVAALNAAIEQDMSAGSSGIDAMLQGQRITYLKQPVTRRRSR
jgi:hypothetical protein